MAAKLQKNENFQKKNVSKIWKIQRILVPLRAILKNGNAFNGDWQPTFLVKKKKST